MKRVCLLFLALASLACAQPPQQGNGQAYPPDRGPYQSAQFFILPGTATPMVPWASAFVNSATGTTQRFYWIVTNDTDNGQLSIPAGPFVVANGPATLSSQSSITIQWPVFALPLTYGQQSPGGTMTPLTSSNISYDVLETSTPVPPSGACGCAVATGLTVSSVQDTGSYSAYTVNIPVWPAGYPAVGHSVTFGPQGILTDSGSAPPPVATDCTPPTSSFAYWTGGSPDSISCSVNWIYDGNSIAAANSTAGMNLALVGQFNLPNCPSPGGTSNNMVNFCNDYNNLSGGFLHWYDFTHGPTDRILPTSFSTTTGPTGIAFTPSGGSYSAVLNGAGFGAAGGSHSKGIVPDPGASAHSPAWYLGDDNNFHAPGGVSPTIIGGTNITQFQIINTSGTFGCTGDQNVCGFTLSWPTTWADSSYSAVCNPTGPSNTSGSESLSYGGSGTQTTSQINVYVVSNGATGGNYSGFVCWGWHQ